VIRHYDGTPDCAAKISAQSKRGAIWAVEWTWRKHRICLTNDEAQRVRGIWKEWKARHGWTKYTTAGHRLQSPDGKREVCNVVKYDPHTRKVLEVR
jgi:hypothetical protein